MLRHGKRMEYNLNFDTMTKENKEWICSVCGHKHIGPEPPKECPVCHVTKEYFDEAGKEPEF